MFGAGAPPGAAPAMGGFLSCSNDGTARLWTSDLECLAIMEHPLNPELFGLPVVDKIAPVPVEIAVYDLTKSIYEQTPVVVPLKKDKDKYIVSRGSDDGYTSSGVYYGRAMQ